MNAKSLPHPAAVLAIVLMPLVLASPASAQKAALTRDIDRPAAQPVTGNCTADTVGGYIKCALYTVPAGKRLVVETVSYQVATPNGSVVQSLAFGRDNGFVSLGAGQANVFLVSPQLAFDQGTGGSRVYAGAQALKMYLDETQTLAASITRTGSGNYGEFFAFSGYLVDK